MNVLGLDIGGANIKAAWGAIHADGGVHALQAKTQSFALWREPQSLLRKLRELAKSFDRFDALAVTMTGELCDCFTTREQGVRQILESVASVAKRCQTGVWSTKGRFISIAQSRSKWIDVASANWHATASHLAKTHADGAVLLIDTGSTTTDLIRIERGKVKARGKTDAQRLATGELVYTGASRTALASIMNEWRGRSGKWQRFAAERFATAADIHTLLGDMPENEADCDTADGQPLTRINAANRVLRMIGSDLSMGTMVQAILWASRFAERQVDLIAAAVSQLVKPRAKVRVVVCGSGAFVAERAARKAQGRGAIIERWSDICGAAASEAACAVALVALAGDPRRGMRGLVESERKR